jgi:hypothetical protein
MRKARLSVSICPTNTPKHTTAIARISRCCLWLMGRGVGRFDRAGTRQSMVRSMRVTLCSAVTFATSA